MQADIVLGRALLRQIRHDFADDAGHFEAVPAEAGGIAHLRRIGQRIDYPVLVDGIC